MSNIDVQKFKLQEARWRILRVLDQVRPEGANDAMIVFALEGAAIRLDAAGVHRELSYLADKGLVKYDQTDEGWYAKLTATGVEVVDYSIPAPTGIARPKRS